MTPQQMNSLPNKEVTEKVVSLLEESSVQLSMTDTLDLIRPGIQELRSGKCSVVVIGEIKKGKSSLVNALLGLKKVLPVSSNVATSTVYRVVYGPERRNVVVFRTGLEMAGQDDSHVMSAEEMVQEFSRLSCVQAGLVEKVVPDEAVELYGTEAGNPGNMKRVDHIRIEVPTACLEHGLEFIDTPGLGGLMKSHAEITWGYIPNAQAVLFVLESVQSPFTKDEQNFLAKIRKITPHIMFVQTKIDVVDQVKWKSWQQRNLEEISKVLELPKDEIPYFTVSSEDKQMYIDKQNQEDNQEDYESSGFKPLERYLFVQLQGVYERALCFELLKPIAQAASEKESELSEALNILKVDTEEKLAELERTYRESQKEFAEFESDELPDIITRLQDRLQDMISDGEKELTDFLQPNQYNPIVDEFVNKVRNSEESPRAIHDKINELASFFTDASAKRASEIFIANRQRVVGFVASEFDLLNRRLTELCPQPSRKAQHSQNSSVSALACQAGSDTASSGLVQKTPDIEFSTYSDIRNTFMGMTLGSGISYMAMSYLAPLAAFAPLLIPVAAIFGGYFAKKHAEKQQRQQLVAHFQQALPGILHQLQRGYARQYADAMNEVKRNVRDEQRRLTKKMKQQMTDRLNEIQELRKKGAQEAEQRGKVLDVALLKARNLKRAVSQATGQTR